MVPIGVGAWVVGVAAYKGIRAMGGPRGKIGLVGDSYAQGLGLAVTGHDPPLQANSTTDFRANGIPGSRTPQWAEIIGTVLKEHPLDWVILSCALNDAALPAERVKTAMRKFVADARAGGAGFAWIQPPQSAIAKVGGNAPGLVKRWRALAGEGRTLRVSDATIGPLAPDGLHPVSYTRWAECLWGWLAGLTA